MVVETQNMGVFENFMSSQHTLVESPPAVNRSSKYMYWILTIKFNSWRIPDTVYKNVKYMRGQLEHSKTNYLHWQIAVQYYKPQSFIVVKQQFSKHAHVEPIFSVAAWNYVWKSETALSNTQFELGDDSDLKSFMQKRSIESLEIRHDKVATEPIAKVLEIVDRSCGQFKTGEIGSILDLDILKQQLLDLSENLWFIPTPLLNELSCIISQAEKAINLDENSIINEVNCYEQTQIEGAEASKPLRHGQKWTDRKIQELDEMLKSTYTVEEIATYLRRSITSIRLKACEYVTKRENYFVEALESYHSKITYEDVKGFVEFNNNRKRRRIKS